MDKNNFLSKIYYDVKNAAFLGNAKKIKEHLNKQENLNFRKKDINKWISQQDVTTLHKQHVQPIGRNHYTINAIDGLWELDLCNMVAFEADNSGYKHILTIIDVFSKYAFAQPVRNKTALEIFNAFRKIITQSGRKPKKIQSDLGLEFKNNIFRKYCYANNIIQNYPQIQSLHKCAVIERFNRTLKEMLFKYFTFKGPGYRRYIDVLQDIITHYNNKKHSTIKIAPSQVKPEHTAEIYNNTKKRLFKNHKEEKDFLYVNDYVRIIKKKVPLEHKYTEKWTREVFQVTEIINKKPYHLYKVKDLHGTSISGKFYFDQLQKLKIAPTRPIKIIKSRGLGPTLEHYIETANRQHTWMPHKKYIETKL